MKRSARFKTETVAADARCCRQATWNVGSAHSLRCSWGERWRRISVENGTRGPGIKNLTHMPSEKRKLRTKKLISYKSMIYRRVRLISRPGNIPSRIAPHLQAHELLRRCWLDVPFFAPFAHKSSLSQTLNGLACCYYSTHFLNCSCSVIPK